MFLRRHARARRRLTAVALLLLAAFSTGPFVLPHIDPGGDVESLATVAVAHDAGAHRIGGSHESDLHQHCAICHLVRTSASPSQGGAIVREGAARPERIATPFVLPVSLRHWSTAPGRAPPAGCFAA